ncbi:MAG: TIGR03943 family protein [Syntrophomonas sp.]
MAKDAWVKRYEAYKAMILLGFCGMLSYYLLSQKIKLYINPRFTILAVAADIVIFVLFIVQGAKVFSNKALTHCHHQTASIWHLVPFIIPLVFVLVMPNAALDASIAADRGVNIRSADASPNANGYASDNTTNSPGNGQSQSGTGSRQYNSPTPYDYSQDPRLIVTDDNFVALVAQIYENPEKFVGKDISMLGFVVRDADFSFKQIGIVRYVITCCTADALPCGLLCEYENASNLKDGTWLEISGTIEMVKLRNTNFAAVKIKCVQTVREPQMPYVYPVY